MRNLHGGTLRAGNPFLLSQDPRLRPTRPPGSVLGNSPAQGKLPVHSRPLSGLGTRLRSRLAPPYAACFDSLSPLSRWPSIRKGTTSAPAPDRFRATLIKPLFSVNNGAGIREPAFCRIHLALIEFGAQVKA